MVRRLEYFLRETFQALRRNGLLVFAAVSTAFIALFLLGGALLVGREVNLLVAQTEANIQVAVYLQDGISPSLQQNIQQILIGMSQVASVHYESKSEAYARFQVIFKTSKALTENVSPDALPASFRVQLKDPNQFSAIAARLVGQAGIEKIVDNRETYSRLLAVGHIFRTGVIVIALVMLISSAALIGNTVRMAVFARRRQIEIMRLVGATNWTIRMPFVLEGVFEGLLGAGVAIAGLFILKVAFIDPMHGNVGFLPLIGNSDIVWPAIPALLAASLVVSVTASVLATRKFLRV